MVILNNCVQTCFLLFSHYHREHYFVAAYTAISVFKKNKSKRHLIYWKKNNMHNIAWLRCIHIGTEYIPPETTTHLWSFYSHTQWDINIKLSPFVHTYIPKNTHATNTHTQMHSYKTLEFSTITNPFPPQTHSCMYACVHACIYTHV